MAGYLGSVPVPQATQHRETFTATAGQTTFNTAGYTPLFIDVYLNGVHLSPADITATNGSDVVLAECVVNDIVDIVSYTPFEVASQTFTGTTTMTDVVAASLDISGNIDIDGVTNLDVVDIDGAVDMASTLAVAGVVTANAGVVVDNITIDGTEIDLSSGDLTLDVAGDIILDADGSNVTFKDATSTRFDFLLDATPTIEISGGNFTLESKANNSSMYFKGLDDSAGVTALTLDFADAGTATFNHDVKATGNFDLPNANTFITGAGHNVVQVDSTKTYLYGGTGGVQFRTADNASALVDITNSGNVMIGTTTEGAAAADNFTISGSGNVGMTIRSTSSNDSAVYFSDGTSGASEYQGYIAYAHADSTFRFGAQGVERMRIDSSGNVLVGKTSTDFGTAGATYAAAGNASLVTDGGSPLFLNRLQEGGLIEFYEAGGARGQIDVFQDRLLIRGAGDVTGLRFDSGNYTVFKNGSGSDDAVDLGFGSGRFDDIFATNATIQTSDRNDKQDIAALTSKEMLVAKRISTLFKTFRWKTKVAEKAAKGETARTHTGVIAQDVQDAFTAEGLDAGDYSLFIESPWWEKDVEVAAVEANEDEGIEAADAYTRTDKWASEDEAPEGSTKKTRLGMRYPELLSFLAAYNEQRFAAIETRLTALEG